MKVNVTVPYTMGDMGGGVVQMKNTAKSLERIGVDVDMRPLTEDVSDCDILHFFGSSYEFSRICKIAKRKGFKVVVTSIHSKRKNDLVWWSWGLLDRLLPVPTFYSLQKDVLDSADAIAVASEGEGESLATCFGVSHDQMYRVPMGVNNVFLEEVSSQKFVDEYGIEDFVLQVSRITPNKGQLSLIKSLRDVDVPIVFAGPFDGGSENYYRKFTNAVKSNGNVYYLGSMSQDDLAYVYSAASVHVLPSQRELLGFVTLEAAACGCAVVSSPNPTLKSYLGDRVYYCDPNSLESIRRNTIVAFEEGPPGGLSEYVRSRFTWKRAAKKLKATYGKIVNSG